jgi:hypothetical protein
MTDIPPPPSGTFVTAESVSPKLYGGKERVVSWFVIDIAGVRF